MSCTVTEGCSHWPKIRVCLGVGDVSGQLGAGGRSASSLPNRQLRHCDVPAGPCSLLRFVFVWCCLGCGLWVFVFCCVFVGFSFWNWHHFVVILLHF